MIFSSSYFFYKMYKMPPLPSVTTLYTLHDFAKKVNNSVLLHDLRKVTDHQTTKKSGLVSLRGASRDDISKQFAKSEIFVCSNSSKDLTFCY